MQTLVPERCTAEYDCYYDSLLFGYVMIPKPRKVSLQEVLDRTNKKVMSKRNPIHTPIANLSGEVWKPITWNGGIYANDFEVSNLGRVRSRANGDIITTYFAPTRKANQVHLGETTCPNVAHLVATEFVPNPNGLSRIDRLDGNYQNDKWDNLVWY